MSKIKLVLTGLGVFAVVSSALALKSFNPNLSDVRICSATNVCIRPVGQQFSTTQGVNPQVLQQNNPYWTGTGTCNVPTPTCTKLVGGTTIFDQN